MQQLLQTQSASILKRRLSLNGIQLRLFLLLGVCLFWIPKNSFAQTVTIGSTSVPVVTPATSTYLYGPIYRSSTTSVFDYSMYAHLYTAAELGIPAGSIITNLEWLKSDANTLTGNNTFKVYLENTTNSTLVNNTTWGTLVANATQVYNSTTQDFTGAAGTYFGVPTNTITPFVYTGGNLQILMDHTKNGTASGALNFVTNPAPGLAIGMANSIVLNNSTALTTSSYGDRRPTIRITYMPGSNCVAPPTAGTATTSASNSCAGANFTLNLSGNSIGVGQTYQWQTSPNGTTGWTNTGTAGIGSMFNTSQTTTTYYRAAVTCSGQTTFSTPVLITSPALVPASTFTVNKNVPASATNFQSLTAAVNHISCGISGPIVFNVVAGSGPYNEQVVIPAIGGTSATNTITFNGNGNMVTNSTPAGAHMGIFTLDGTDFVTLDNFVITLDAAATSGWGIQLKNQANNNNITNNTINLPLTATTTLINGIVAGSSTVSAGSNASNTLIQNNIINGGYYSINLNGSTGGADAFNNRIIGNQIRDTYVYNMYLLNTSGTLVEGNSMSRPTRTSVSTFYGVFVSGASPNLVISKNRIHNTHGAASSLTGTVYGIYHSSADQTAGNESIVKNNLIYNINNTGPSYLIYNSSSDGVYYFHNTIDMSRASNATGLARGFYQITLATNIKFNNNIIVIDDAGTGTKHAIYLGTITSTISSNRNVLYISPASTNSHIGYYSVNQTTFANWQAANSGAYDQNSVSADPVFANRATGNLTPTSVLVNNIGAPVTPPVTDDILGNPRSTTTPDPGAYEFTLSAVDAGATALASPVNQPCLGSSEQVSITIRNWGTSPLDFAANNTTVTVNVTGAVTQTLTITLNNNSLNGGQPLIPGGTLVVPVGTLNMSATGTYTFNATATVAGDANAANNAMPVATITAVPVTAGTASASRTTLCLSGTTTLNLAGSAGGNVQWQQASSATGPFTNIAGATSASYTLAAPISQTAYYQAVVSCGSNSATTNVVTVTVNNPTVTASSGDTRCGAGAVTLTATPSAGATINWYDAATGGIPLATGNTYTTNVSTTTTFYAAASTGGGTGNVGPTSNTIGTGLQSSAPQWLLFDVFVPTTLQGVYVYPGAAGNVVLQWQSNTATAIQTTTVAVTASDVNQKTFIPLNWSLTPGTGYRLALGTGSVNLFRNDAGASYPYTLPGVLSVTGNSFDPTYYYWGYDWQVSTGCESTRVPVVATVSGPATPTITAGGSTSFCTGGSVTLTGASTTSGATYQWMLNGTPIPGATSATYTANAAGSYTVVASSGSCSSNPSAATVVTVNAKPATPTITVAAGNSTTICQGGSVALTGASTTAGVTYRWSRNGAPIAGATAASYTASIAGNYRVIAMSGGCSDSSAVTAVTVNPKPATPAITKTGNMLSSSVTTGTYQWYSVSGTTFTPVAGATSQTFTPATNGNYTVRITVNGCQSDAPTAMNVVLGISSLAPGMDVSVYPNPSAGKFTVNLVGFEKEASIQIINVTGQVVASEKVAISSDKASKAFDLGGMAKGVYILKVTSGDNLAFRKVILD